MAVLAIVIVQLVVGYGNDRASCTRSANTRVFANIRSDTSIDFWGRRISDAYRDDIRASKRTEAALMKIPGRIALATRRHVSEQITHDYVLVGMFGQYSDEIKHEKAPVPDCSKFPPPSG